MKKVRAFSVIGLLAAVVITILLYFLAMKVYFSNDSKGGIMGQSLSDEGNVCLSLNWKHKHHHLLKQ